MEKEMETLAGITGDTLISLIQNRGITETVELGSTMKSTGQRLKKGRAEGATRRFEIEFHSNGEKKTMPLKKILQRPLFILSRKGKYHEDA